MLRAIKAMSMETGKERVASMGYPDIISPMKELERALGAKVYQLKFREDSEKITKWHKTELKKIPTSESFFELMGMKLDVYDAVKHRGGEIVRDLNYPLPEDDLEQYDFVLDVGTLEHCFNIGQAAINMAGLLKENGIIFHENPFNWMNHGFYGLNPTWYHDFYYANGFEIVDMLLVTTDGQQVKDVEQTGRINYSGPETNICVAARRNTAQEFKFPVQSKYQKMFRRAAMGG